ncbi:MAG: GNAT family N-acetyltransferase [Caldilineaceae bacterium]
MNRRAYQDDTDLALLQSFNAHAFAQADGCGYLHPGDIPHRLFSGNKFYDPAEVMSIWEDANGVAAWVMAQPRHRAFDAQVRPDLRGGGFEREVLQYAEARTVKLMQRYKIESDHLYAEAFRCDTTRTDLLMEVGWQRVDKPPWVVNRAALVDLPAPVIPEGYSMRAATGPEEAAALAAVHVGAFGSTWTPELYRQVMAAPGYAAEREFVMVAADGAFAAFTVTWRDGVNRTGLFEPVGTHADHRRRGLGRALLLSVMHKMAADGLEHAIVVNQGANEASRSLYRACGFKPWLLIDDFTKAIAH